MTDLVWDSQSKIKKAALTDPSGNKYFFDNYALTKATDSSGQAFENVLFDSNGALNSAELTLSGAKYVYQDKKLVKSTDPAGVVTDYSYASGKIIAKRQGTTHTYDLNKTLLEMTDPQGKTTFFKDGKRVKDTQNGELYLYEYQDPTHAEVGQHLKTGYVLTTIQTDTQIKASDNPLIKYTVSFPDEHADNPWVMLSVAGKKVTTLDLTLAPGQSPAYSFNKGKEAGSYSSLRIDRDSKYVVEVLTDNTLTTGNITVWIYKEGLSRPSSPTGQFTAKNWAPQFILKASNASTVLGASNSGYGYTTTSESTDSLAANQPPGSAQKISFRFNAEVPKKKTNTISLLAIQPKLNKQTPQKTYSFAYNAGTWTITVDNNKKKATTQSQTLTPGKLYQAEVRMEKDAAGLVKVALYVYEEGQSRQSAVRMAVDGAADRDIAFTASLTNAPL